MSVIFRIFDADGNLIVDENTLVFRILGTQRIVGASTGNADISGNSGSIVHDGFTAGSPFLEVVWCGTAGDGVGSSWDPLPPNYSFSGNTLNYANLWGDWVFTYGVA